MKKIAIVLIAVVSLMFTSAPALGASTTCEGVPEGQPCRPSAPVCGVEGLPLCPSPECEGVPEGQSCISGFSVNKISVSRVIKKGAKKRR